MLSAERVTNFFDGLSLWVITPMLALILVGLHEAGVQLRRFVQRRSRIAGAPPTEEDDDAVGGHLGAALGLMALLVGFSFGMSLSRFNTLRALVPDEAWAITADYRHLLAVPEPERTRLANDLLRYLDAREAFSRAGQRSLAGTEAASHRVSNRLWLDTLSAAREHKSPEIQAVIATTDAMLKAAFARESALAEREPPILSLTMLLYVFVATTFMGYGAKPGRRLLGASTVQLVLLALAISLILDLDRARGGTIRVDQTPLLDVATRIRQAEAGRSQAPAEAALSPRD